VHLLVKRNFDIFKMHCTMIKKQIILFDVKGFGANQEQPETSRLALWSLMSNEVLKSF